MHGQQNIKICAFYEISHLLLHSKKPSPKPALKDVITAHDFFPYVSLRYPLILPTNMLLNFPRDIFFSVQISIISNYEVCES